MPSERQHPVELILVRQLAERLSAAVFVIDEEGDLLYFNEAAEHLLGIHFDEIGEMPFEEWSTSFAPRDDAGRPESPDALPLVVAARDRRPAHAPLTITGRDGVERRISVSAFPLDGAHGQRIGAMAIFWEDDDA